MTRIIQILIFLFFSALSSCMLGPNYQKVEYEGPDKFRFDSTSTAESINLKWWELMDDTVLNKLITTALEQNKDVLIAASRIEAARANIGYTKAGQWPSFMYGVGVNAGGMSGANSSGFSAFPEFSWEIGFWGKYRRMNESAQADFLASEYAKRTIQMSLITSVASTYFTILASYDQLVTAQNTLSSRENGFVIMRDKYEGGLISLMDLNQAKIQRDVAATVVPTYKRVIATNESSLSLLLGEIPKEIITGVPFHKHAYILDIPIGIPSEMLERRPDVQQAAMVYKSTNADIGVAEAMRWPSINLTGMMGAASSDLASLNAIGLTWSTGVSIFGPIFQFGKNKRRVEIARENTKISLLQYQRTTQQAFKDVEDALVSISTYKEELVAQESRTKTAILSEELSHIRYEEGSTTYLEVLEQQRQSFSAQLDLLTNRLNLLNSYILLYKSLGGGWLSADEERAYLEQQNTEN